MNTNPPKSNVVTLALMASMIFVVGSAKVDNAGSSAECEIRCDATLSDTLFIFEEPLFTQGTSNTIFFKFPDWSPEFLDSLNLDTRNNANARLFLRVENNGRCDQTTPHPDYDLRVVDPDSVYSLRVTKFIGEPLRSGETYKYSLGLQIFTCPDGICIDDSQLKMVCLRFPASIVSTQDAEPPFTQLDPGFTQTTCETDSSFAIPFKAWDEISGGIDRTTLWVRHDSTGAWISEDTLAVEIAANSQDSASTVDLPFVRSQDGLHEFLITARDTARHPRWTPENPLEAGNEPPRPDSSTAAQASLQIDTVVPESKVGTLIEVQDLLCFEIPYSADDPKWHGNGYESGLVSVILFCSHNDSDFIPVATDSFNSVTDPVDSVFDFKAKGDGTYRFYTQATDACGNVEPFGLGSVVTTEVNATPSIVYIWPDTTKFHHAEDIDSVEVIFDRIVSFSDSSCDILQVVNQYNNSRRVDGSCVTETTDDSTTKIIWFPDPPLRTSGWYDVSVDLSTVQTRDPECGLEGQGRDFDFYTFMEKEQGGSILTPTFHIKVPMGVPSDTIVIQEQDVKNGICQYERAQEIENSQHRFESFLAPEQQADIDVPARLAIAYNGLSITVDPRTLRIFEKLPDGCLPSGEKETWRVDTDSGFVYTNVENVNSEFCLVSISADIATEDDAVANYPNPFGNISNETKITYTVTDPSASLSLRIYDQFGNLVKSFRPDQLTRHLGLNECPWDGRNDLGELVASGGYICVFENGDSKYMRKIAVLR